MAINHVTAKAPGNKLFAVADWNAGHAIQKVGALPAAVEGDIIFLTTDQHFYVGVVV